VKRSAGEGAVGQHTQPELDSLWNLEPVQFTEQWGGVSTLHSIYALPVGGRAGRVRFNNLPTSDEWRINS